MLNSKFVQRFTRFQARLIPVNAEARAMVLVSGADDVSLSSHLPFDGRVYGMCCARIETRELGRVQWCA